MDLPKRMRLVSDGSALGTQIFDKNGEKLRVAASRIVWSIAAGQNAKADVELVTCAGDTEADVSGYFVFIDGERKEIRRIEFADGSEMTFER